MLDPFCGCGTAIAVAQKLEPPLDRHRHHPPRRHPHEAPPADAFGEGVKTEYEVVGEPTDVAGAEQLAHEDPYQFQWWALGLVGARPVEQKKGADKGIDGRIYFHERRPDATSSRSSSR